jgi:hypothetical protein
MDRPTEDETQFPTEVELVRVEQIRQYETPHGVEGVL